MSPNMAVMPSVKLNAHLRPKTSHPNPQNIAPASRPMFWARDRRGARPGLNSFLTGVTAELLALGARTMRNLCELGPERGGGLFVYISETSQWATGCRLPSQI